MYRVFAGFEVPEVVVPIADHIDTLVVRHGGPVVRRKHPLHVTVMAPRAVRECERRKLEEFTRDFNTDYGNVPCRIDALECHEHRRKKFFVADLVGQQLNDSIDHFHAELARQFSWTRGQYEGTKPHITLISSRHTRGHQVFERVVDVARAIEIPRELITLPRLVLHVRKEGPKQPPTPVAQEEPHEG